MYLHYLNHNPLAVFQNSKTPAALYARQKWMREEDTEEWQSDFRETVNSLLSGQKKDGSWEGSLLKTIHRLFGLHLTIRNMNEQIELGIKWLLSHGIIQKAGSLIGRRSNFIYARDLQNLPFSRGCDEHVLTCAILFLASIFGYESNKGVISAYDILSGTETGKKAKWCDWSCSNNFLRASVVHPHYQQSKAVISYISALQKVQKSDGGWPAPIPFYQTVNALAHLDYNQSDDLLRRAFHKLQRSQNRDGTWGTTGRQWNTFLVVHAIRRKSALLENMQKLS